MDLILTRFPAGKPDPKFVGLVARGWSSLRPAYDLRPLYNPKQTYKPEAQYQLNPKPNNQPSSPNSSVAQPAKRSPAAHLQPTSREPTRNTIQTRTSTRASTLFALSCPAQMSALSCPAQMSAHVKLQWKQPFRLSELDGTVAAIRLDFPIFA